jgi:hypothetical protein
MSEEHTEKKMHELRKLGKDHAEAKKIMKEKMINSNTGKMDSVNAQEREARADDRYKKHIDNLAEAVGKEAELNWEKYLVQINFDTWKTKTINKMQEYKNYGNKE